MVLPIVIGGVVVMAVFILMVFFIMWWLAANPLITYALIAMITIIGAVWAYGKARGPAVRA